MEIIIIKKSLKKDLWSKLVCVREKKLTQIKKMSFLGIEIIRGNEKLFSGYIAG